MLHHAVLLEEDSRGFLVDIAPDSSVFPTVCGWHHVSHAHPTAPTRLWMVESETGEREDGMERDGYAQLIVTFVYQRDGRKLTVVPCHGIERILQPRGRLALPAVPMESNYVFSFISHAMDRILSFPRHPVHVGSWC